MRHKERRLNRKVSTPNDKNDKALSGGQSFLCNNKEVVTYESSILYLLYHCMKEKC